MDDDLTLKIGADADPIRQELDAAGQYLQRWAASIQDRLSDNSTFKIDADFEGIEDALDGSNEKLAGMVASASRLVGIIGLVSGIAIQIYNTTIDLTKEWSGYNKQLERSKELTGQIADQNERISKAQVAAANTPEKNDALQEQIGRELGPLEGRKRRLEAGLKVAKTQEFLERNGAGGIAKAGASRITGAIFGLDSERIKKDLDEVQVAIDRLNKKRKAADKNGLEVAKQQQTADAKRVEDQDDINAAIQRQIDLQKEAELRANGDTEGADAIKSRMRVADNTKAFGGDANAAREVEDATQSAERAKKRAERAKKLTDAKAKSEREHQQDLDKRGRLLEELSRKTEAGQQREERANDRIAAKRDEIDKVRSQQDRVLGGFDSGLLAMSDRIANASSTPKEDKVTSKLEELKRLEEDKLKEQVRTTEAIDKVEEAISKINTGLV